MVRCIHEPEDESCEDGNRYFIKILNRNDIRITMNGGVGVKCSVSPTHFVVASTTTCSAPSKYGILTITA